MKVLMTAIATSLGVSGIFCSPSAAASFALLQHKNGALLSLNEETLPFASDEVFPVNPGDVIEFSRGFTEFNLTQAETENVWQVQIFPGDSFASFCLAGECLEADPNAPLQLDTSLPSGQGNVIAYGFVPNDVPPVRLTLLEPEAPSVPEPGAVTALILLSIPMSLAQMISGIPGVPSSKKR